MDNSTPISSIPESTLAPLVLLDYALGGLAEVMEANNSEYSVYLNSVFHARQILAKSMGLDDTPLSMLMGIDPYLDLVDKYYKA
jgi:hypothetical protein